MCYTNRNFGGSTLSCVGKTREILKNAKTGKKCNVVCEKDVQPILGLRAAEQMNLLYLQNENFEEVCSLSSLESLSVFNDDLGNLPGVQHLTTDPEVKPVIMPNRRVPVAVKDRLKQELDRLTKLGVITPVTEPTPWRKILELFGALPGVVAIHDDVIVHGRTRHEHDLNLQNFLSHCGKYGVRLNRDKLELASNKITFMGHVISSDGIKTDPEKVRAIRDFPPPTCLTEVRRFLGMVQYLSRYIPHLTDDLHPIQNLTKKDVPFLWSESQKNAFLAVKSKIVDSPCLAIYDPHKELTLENDASEYGLGSVLLQDGKPLGFASRTLSEAERNYAQIEKELLAVIFGMNKFYHYTFARPVTVVTDHKPLVSIANKPLSKAPKRLQSMFLKLQAFDFNLIYKPGTQLHVSDSLSRAPLPTVNAVHTCSNISHSPFKDSRLSEIKAATVLDPVLSQLKLIILQGWPDLKSDLPSCVLPYFNYRDELTVQDGIILRGDRIVIPSSLRQDLKSKVHAGHHGINSCLRRARDLIFWPGMSNDIVLTTVIHKLKHHFARHGIPEVLISDNGTQYTSEEFSTFVSEWKFRHERSAPGNKKANGAAEAAVKVIKNLMIKCRHSKEDPYIGLLNLRNTPTEGLSTSPAQRLMGRRTQSIIPSTDKALDTSSKIPVSDRMAMDSKKFKASQKNSNRPSLKPLFTGDTVRMQPIDNKKEWKEAKVTKSLGFNTFEVFDGSKFFRRNRQFLRKRKSRIPIRANPTDKPCQSPVSIRPSNSLPLTDTKLSNRDSNLTPATDLGQNPRPVPETIEKKLLSTTRSGRIVKPPDRLVILPGPRQKY
ncbi:hypothetical protein EGW08_023750 [Elysia chlorotica]|uniref:Integrase catalytic domain-containing protein n=1 Tax=Elysia chlorotica TaxID=188477 RepID=A0A433SIB4_ELYCH|nr:hypothetical protein EGW08_023750 [Elysia chlorotica]